MSGSPFRPRSRELEIVRVLFDRHLLERAVNLGEARWPGSGDMVRLAYHWRDLAPAERRERLEQIGPERLAEFRELAALDPDLSQVLDTLDERGVLSGSLGQRETRPEVEPVTEPEPAMTDPAPEPEEILAPPPDAPDAEAGGSGWARELPDEIVSALDVELSDLGLAPESLEDFIATEQERRSEALASGEEMLRRVRDRLDSTARQLTSNPIGGSRSAATLPVRMSPGLTTQPGSASVVVDTGDHTFTPPGYWLKRLNEERVVVVDGRIPAPTDDQLIALANELGIGIAEFAIEPGATLALFGGLKRDGGAIQVEIGPLPTALADRRLVVVHGRMFPKVIERLRAGMCDIPGTRTSVRVAPDSRVLIIP